MNRRIRTALLASCLLGLFSNPLHADGLSQYNVVWNSPSASALESMPCGGGDVGMNVWVEDGNLLIYLSRSGTFDELNTFPKLGRIRVSVSPNVLDDPDTFRQELRLEEGEVEIRSRKGSEEVTLRVWADVFRPMVHIDLPVHDLCHLRELAQRTTPVGGRGEGIVPHLQGCARDGRHAA